MEKDNKYLRAKERIEEVKKFYNHVFSTVFVIALTGGINYYLDKWENPWFLWVVCGTGIGLVFHASKTFGLNLFLGRNWEERKIKEFMDEEEHQKRWE